MCIYICVYIYIHTYIFIISRTCVSGQTCLIDGFVSTQLGLEAKVVLLDTCGYIGGPIGSGGTTLTTTQGVSFFIAVTNLTELGEASWGYNTEITPAGGEYRLCWCSAQFQCNEAHDFRVDFGALTVIGPQPLDQQRTCISGMDCVIDGLTGHYIETEDSVAILDTCGTDTLVLGFPYPALISVGDGDHNLLYYNMIYYNFNSSRIQQSIVCNNII